MSGIKGLVILTRFDYIEKTYGKDRLKDIFDKIEIDDTHPLNQPIGISKDYPEILLKTIDDLMLSEFLKNNTDAFLEIGHWNAQHLLPRYFQNYIDEKNPEGFLLQMVRLRDVLIGLGDMHIVDVSKNSFMVRINYGQPFLESVRLSEWGFLQEGCRMCDASNVKSEELNKNEISVEYQISWDS
jgi:hypothetical protein